MGEKLKDYQVLDVFCGGTFYKVRHKVTNNIFAWKAYNCSAYSDEQVQNVVNEVKTISKVSTQCLLRYYDTILHGPSKTLYFVLEYNSWRSVQELIEICEATDKLIAETFIWHLLHELARVCKAVDGLNIVVLQKCITAKSIFVDDSGDLRIDCFELATGSGSAELMTQIGDVLYTLCYRAGAVERKIKEFHYSDDLRDMVAFLRDERSAGLRPDVVLHHPTVLMNLETKAKQKCLSDILVSVDKSYVSSEVNKCDSEKAVELCRAVQPLPRTIFNIADSPVYCNISTKCNPSREIQQSSSPASPLSPTIAALALELPGFVPRSRKPYSESLEKYNFAQKVSEDTLSQEWMSRLVSLRQREHSLNKRERELIAKEIVSSPSAKVIPLTHSVDVTDNGSNGITLPPMMSQAQNERRSCWARRRASSVRPKARRKSYAYEDLDSSLSADAGDGSVVVTGAKMTAHNMPRRNIFPDAAKKVHFTATNPFTESDDSVTLTFYELDNVDGEGYQLPRQEVTRDISKFKYLDLKKTASEKRASMHWAHSSPSKQAKTTKNVFGDITNSMRKTPSKTSLTSKGSNSSRQSMFCRSEWSMESSSTKVSEGSIAERTRSALKQSLTHTPIAPTPKKLKSRKSLLSFKTPFKFFTATNI